MQKQKSKDKKWVGWFRPNGRGTKHGSLIAATIDIFNEPSLSGLNVKRINDETDSFKQLGKNKRNGLKLLVVSVPSSCGTAVQRNRFRRIVKARFARCFLNEKIVGDLLENGKAPGGKPLNKSSQGKAEKKGLWIRLLNRHRLGRKIRLEDWKKEFDEIESLYGQFNASL